jgi:rhamnose utilization protein RhaD (predicted bifunctional aldolase and dehydrogenase)
MNNPDKQMILDDLVRLSNQLGRPEADHVILGEGNTSALIDESTFFVKASGEQLADIGRDGFVEVDLERALALLDKEKLADDQLKEALLDTCVSRTPAARPSIEVLMHAVALKYGQARFVGHTHTTEVTAILCSDRANAFAHARLFPDQVVLCGPDSATLPYVAPGLPLGRGVYRAIVDYIDAYQVPPKSILLKKHGITVLGQTAQEVLNMLAMWKKAARIYAGAAATGTPVALTDAEIEHIYHRADERYRRAKLT